MVVNLSSDASGVVLATGQAYGKTNKNDARDAVAICEVVRRPNMRFVAIPQQELLMLGR